MPRVASTVYRSAAHHRDIHSLALEIGPIDPVDAESRSDPKVARRRKRCTDLPTGSMVTTIILSVWSALPRRSAGQCPQEDVHAVPVSGLNTCGDSDSSWPRTTAVAANQRGTKAARRLATFAVWQHERIVGYVPVATASHGVEQPRAVIRRRSEEDRQPA